MAKLLIYLQVLRKKGLEYTRVNKKTINGSDSTAK